MQSRAIPNYEPSAQQPVAANGVIDRVIRMSQSIEQVIASYKTA